MFIVFGDALSNTDGPQSAAVMDSATINFYYQMGQQALYANKKTLQGLTPVEKLLVVGIRLRSSYEKITSLNGAEVFAYLFEMGMVQSGSVSADDLSKIEIKGNEATAIVDKNIDPTTIWFFKENGAWKINLTKIFPKIDALIMERFVKNGQAEEDFMASLEKLAKETGLKVNIYTPLSKRK